MARSFQGQNDAPAPPQGYNQSVHDAPKHGAGTSAPKPASTRPIDQNDPYAELERRHAGRVKNAPGDKIENQSGNVGSK